MIKRLEKIRKNLKVRNIKQMRRQGLVVEVVDQNDIKAIRSCDFAGPNSGAAKKD